MSVPTKYVQMEWKIQGVNRDSVKNPKILQSQKFDIHFGAKDGKLRFCLQFITGKLNDINIDMTTIQNPDESMDFDAGTGNVCAAILSFLEHPGVDSCELKNSFLNYRFCIVNANQEEKLQFGGTQVPLKTFAQDITVNGWGQPMSWQRIFDENKKLVENCTLTFKVYIEVHTRTNDVNQRPFSHLFNADTFSDFKIACKEREFFVHLVVLSAYAPNFLRILQTHNTGENKVMIEDFDETIVNRVLYYIYTGQIGTLRGVEEKSLLYAAIKYQICDLKKLIIDSMSALLNKKNAFETLAMAHHYNEDILLRNCATFIKTHSKTLMEAASFEQKLLIKIIEINPVYSLLNKLIPSHINQV